MRLSECYALLEVSPSASLDEIKANYRRLAFKYHPDFNPNESRAARQFSRLNEAYVILKKHSETLKNHTEKKIYDSEAIIQEEGKSQNREFKNTGTFYAKQEDVLKDILNDPFAKQVFDDIFSKLKKGIDPSEGRAEPEQIKTLSFKYGKHLFHWKLGQSVLGSIRNWLAGQLDDYQTVSMPPRNLLPGTTIRVKIKHSFQSNSQTIELTLPSDFIVGRPIRLKGLGRQLGPWKGDLYLRLLAK